MTRRTINKRQGKYVVTEAPDHTKIFPCQYRGEPTGETARCNLCGAKDKDVEVYACSMKGTCTPTLRVAKIQWCKTCEVFRGEAG